jgi:hypothetical protein
VPWPQYVRMTTHTNGSAAAGAPAAELFAAMIHELSNNRASQRHRTPVTPVAELLHL